MSNRWNQCGFSILHWLYIWGHRWILALLLIFADLCKHSNTNVAGFKCILNQIWCIIWRPKRFLIKMSTLYNGLHNKFGLYLFPNFIGLEFGIYRSFTVPNLKCIHAVFAMLWPFQKLLVSRCPTCWSVAKLFLVSVNCTIGTFSTFVKLQSENQHSDAQNSETDIKSPWFFTCTKFFFVHNSTISKVCHTWYETLHFLIEVKNKELKMINSLLQRRNHYMTCIFCILWFNKPIYTYPLTMNSSSFIINNQGEIALKQCPISHIHAYNRE